MNSFEVQEFELDAGSAALSFSVSPQFINNVAPELLTHRVNCRSFLYAGEEQPAFHALRQDLARAFQMFYKRENDGTAYAKSGAAAILEDLGRYFLDRNQRVEYSGAQESLQKITQYVQHNYRQRVTLDELSKHTFLSKTYISRIFTRYLGIFFTGYLELLRLSSAIQMAAGQGTLEQIAQASGFPNVDAMTVAFKRHWGVTPGEYRRTFSQRGNPPVGAIPSEEGSGLFASLLRYAGAAAPAGPAVACVRELTVDTPEEADAAVCFVESPISLGYDPEDRKAGGNGYVPVTLQYRPYCAVNAREHSIAGGDPLESGADRGYRGKWNRAANEADLDIVLETKRRMGNKPVVTVVTLKNPMVMAELEPSTDALLIEYGVTPQAVADVLAGAFTPEGLLPVQIPADMDAVERQREDVAFDMECYRDSEGHTYDFGFGMNYDGMIRDERTRRYKKGE